MSFPAQLLDKTTQNCLQKCFYMMNLIRNVSPEIWEMYQPVYATLKPEESWEFYHLLIDEYRKLQEAPKPAKAVRKKAAPKKKVAAKKTAAKKPAAKKTAAKKTK